MKLPRRSFLGLAATAGCAAPRAAVPVSVTNADKWTQVRGEFALAKDRVHLAGLLLASNPAPVRALFDDFRRRLDEDPVTTLEHDFETGAHTNATLDAAAKYLGGARDEIALTDSTTSGIAMVYGGLVLERGDEIVTTKHDHFVTHETLRLTAERTGANVKTVTLYEKAAEAKAESMVSAIATAITPATRAVAITWVHSSTGVKTPVREIAAAIEKVNASRGARDRVLLCVDGVHGFGVENATMKDLGCDFFMAGTHKWIFGPRGTGIVWGRPSAWERVRPVACPFHWEYVVAREYGGNVPKMSGPVATPGGFRSFESRWALRAAFDFHLSIGKAAVEGRIHELARRCKTGLAGMKHVTLHTPADDRISAGIVCFEVVGMKPDAVVKELGAVGIIASTTPYRPSYARFTPGITNTEVDVDRALSAVARIGH